MKSFREFLKEKVAPDDKTGITKKEEDKLHAELDAVIHKHLELRPEEKK